MPFFYLWLFVFLSPLSIFALYNGNPSLPMMPEYGLVISKESPVSVKLGYETDWSYDCELYLDLQHLPERHTWGYRSLAQFGVLTLNFMDRVEIFGNLGSFSSRWTQGFNSDTDIFYETDTAFAWAVGGRVIVAYWAELQLSLNASYMDSKPSLTSLQVNDKSYDHQGSRVDFNPWQIGAGLSYRFGWFVPYVGVDYIQLQVEASPLPSLAFLIPQEKALFKNEYNMGIFLGMGLLFRKGWNINFEARFINENAVSVSSDFKF